MEKTTIKAEIVADSLSPQGDRLTSLLITFPRIILAEINTHRMLSKNTSSSRAIPFKKMVEAVQNDPFIPIAWQKHHSGMQGSEYISTEEGVYVCNRGWLEARNTAIKQANWMHSCNVTKQLCNRLLEPFMWTTMLITGSEEGWQNFFSLRCPQYGGTDAKNNEVYFKSKKEAIKHLQEIGVNTVNLKEDDILGWLQINKGQAEIHMMDLAEKIYDAMNESTPKQLKSGEWHIPFKDKINDGKAAEAQSPNIALSQIGLTLNDVRIKISTAMAARTSYTVVGDEKEIDYQKMIELHDKLIEMKHSSPLEHCARAMNDEEYQTNVKGFYPDYNNTTEFDSYSLDKAGVTGWCRNYRGFIQYRHLIETKQFVV